MSQKQRRKDYRKRVKDLTDQSRWFIPGRNIGDVIDHVVPIRFGVNHADEVTPEMIASRENLQWLSWPENNAKSSRITPAAIVNFRLWGLHDLADIQEERINR